MKPSIILSFAFAVLFSCNNAAQKNEQQKGKTDSVKAISKQSAVKDTLVKDGESLTFFDNGKLKFRGMMKNGKRDGLWSSFYESGGKWSETTFTEGIKNGKTTTWFENGQMRYDGFYTNDNESGKWTFWDEKGKVLQAVDYDKKK